MNEHDDNTPAAPWTNVYGLARSLIAISTLATLLVNEPGLLWLPAKGIPDAPLCGEAAPVPNLFCLAPDHLGVFRWIAIIVLAVVASGWRPRFTGVAHWWVTHSFVSSALLVDGGDQLSSTLTLLMLPLTLMDPRRSHWGPGGPWPSDWWGNLRAGLGGATLWVLRLQVAFVYLNAAASKWGETEWSNGTALYYWFADPSFGFTPTLQVILGSLMHDGFVVSTMTWGVIAFEFVLFAGLFIQAKLARHILLGLGIMFHLGIAFVHGLPSFVLIMFGALILLFRREGETFAHPRDVLGRMASRVRSLVSEHLLRPATAPGAGLPEASRRENVPELGNVFEPSS